MALLEPSLRGSLCGGRVTEPLLEQGCVQKRSGWNSVLSSASRSSTSCLLCITLHPPSSNSHVGVNGTKWRWSVVRGELSCQSQSDFSVCCAELFLIDVSVTWPASDDFLLYLVVIHNCVMASHSPLWGRLCFTGGWDCQVCAYLP